MAAINESNAPERKRAGMTRRKKHIIKPDMTPMVDLGFLLIAFFVMTTEMSRPATVKLNMPADKNGPQMPVGESTALTLLIDDDHLFYYHGNWESAMAGGKILETSFDEKTGIGKVIREKQSFLQKNMITKEGADGLVFLIKPGPNSIYRQVIDALDEMQINGVSRYMLVKPAPEEVRYLAEKP